MTLGWVQILVLAAIQGLSGVLPLSDAGFLALGRKILGLPLDGSADRFYHALLQITIALVIFVVFRKDLAACAGLRTKRARRRAEAYPNEDGLNHRMFLLILIALLPMTLAFFLRNWAQGLMTRLPAIGGIFLLYGFILFLCDRVGHGKRGLPEATIGDSLILGFAQTFSAVPGLSGMGLAFTAGILRGLSPAFCIRFSCLLLIPVYLVRNCGTVRRFGWGRLFPGLPGRNPGLRRLLLFGAVASAVYGEAGDPWRVHLFRLGRRPVYILPVFI